MSTRPTECGSCNTDHGPEQDCPTPKERVMLIQGKYKMAITPDKVEAVRSWFKDRGGAVVWHDQEITGSPRPDVMTPATHEDGSPATKPHWSMGNPEPVQPGEICVRVETKVEPPLEWFPKCEPCGATGRRPVAEIAVARGVTLIQCVRDLEANNTPLELDLREDGTIGCWLCRGTGRVRRVVRVQSKRHWTGGYYLTDRAAEKARGLARKLGANVKWYDVYVGYGRAEVHFYTETITPFTLEG